MLGPLRNLPVLRPINQGLQLIAIRLKRYLPRGLFARSLIIIVAPIVLLQLVATYIYMDRYSALVTRRLSASVAGELALVLDVIDKTESTADRNAFLALVGQKENLTITILPGQTIPQTKPNMFFDLLSDTVGTQLKNRIDQPLWYDIDRWPSHVDIQIQLDRAVMQVKVRRSRVLATNWHIFLGWMFFFSFILLTIAIIFLRNQIRPIQRLAAAAEGFGKGRDVPDFKPSGATEVRGAAIAFIDMRNRMSRHIDQRTEMLAGVSHDLRTPLTRMKLQLAMLGASEEIEDLKADISEMEHMLDEYIAFAEGLGTEKTEVTNLGELLEEIQIDAKRKDQKVEVHGATDLAFPLRRMSIKRCINNLINNACTYGSHAVVTAWRKPNNWVEITVDDDGPGIPEAKREEAFRPFHRLDVGRNLDSGGSGLGLAIARDIVRSHGGEIKLQNSPLGGLRALISFPV